MKLVLVGVNHRTAPLALRERVAIPRGELEETVRSLAAEPGVSECLIVSTCNRVEILAEVEQDAAAVDGFLERHFDLKAG